MVLKGGAIYHPVTFELCELMGGEYRVLMKYSLKHPKVVKAEKTDSDETTPTEEVRFNCGEIHWEYTPAVSSDADGILLKGLYNEDGILEVNSEKVIKGDAKLLSFD